MTNEERKVFELALEALLKTQNEGFNLPGSAIREAITAIKEALAQPKKLDQDEVDIRSRLYQRIHELETQLAQPEQEPCKTCNGAGEVETGIGMMVCDDCHGITYTNPPQRKEPEQEPSALYTKTKIEIGCSECGIGGGHALYCVRCAEKFVGGYKENVPVHASELLTQVSTDAQYAGNGTAGIQNETKSTGFFFQRPPHRTWVGLTVEEIDNITAQRLKWQVADLVDAIEAKLKEKNGIKE